MKKRRIVIASILKPLDDTRMVEKLGVSLAQSGRYEVHIIGYPVGRLVSEPHVQLHALPAFRRLSLGRIKARAKALKIILKVKPELLLVTTHELLLVAVLIRILFGTKIIYDIQENYWQNILSTDAFPIFIRPVIALFVRLKEWITAPFFARFLIAEKCYAQELGFVRNKFIAIENKCKVPPGFHRNPCKDFIELIFTGTLAESTGVFQAIALAKKLNAAEPKIRLTIIGYCAQQKILSQIEDAIKGISFIRLVGGKDLVNHAVIMEAIATANFGVISYPVARHTENRIPTKLYEYLACQLPVLLQNHKPWVELANAVDAAIVIDAEQPDMETILKQVGSRSFYLKDLSPVGDNTKESNRIQAAISGGLTWENEEAKLVASVNNIF